MASGPTTSLAVSPDRSRLIASARWVRRGGLSSLAVEPSPSQRGHPTLAWAEAGWRQLVARVPAAATPGMREQYVCHVLFAPTKARFYLEPWRPAQTLAQTVLEACNPGPRKDLG
ncbi:MAG TPA: DUF2599 domain-containing protein [Dermatophilaceae bacterium]|nr:DUF2599 domain-containing protein [Dermatophilaceae bacterium]